jgi:hypothetical protein
VFNYFVDENPAQDFGGKQKFEQTRISIGL